MKLTPDRREVLLRRLKTLIFSQYKDERVIAFNVSIAKEYHDQKKKNFCLRTLTVHMN